MNLTLYPASLRGEITPPPSKSQAHRLIIAAALGEGACEISNVAFSEDILATLRAMEQLGAKWEALPNGAVAVQGIGGRGSEKAELPLLDCGESGSTLRFLIPIAMVTARGGRFTGRGRLMQRPQKPYFDLFEEKGIDYDLSDGVLTVRGSLAGGEYALAGNVSSQFFTGLLFALPLAAGESTVRATTPLESRSYIDMTMDVLRRSGVRVTEEGDSFRLEGNQRFSLSDCSVEADWSQAGFYYAAKGIGNEIDVTGMNANSVQGDKRILSFYMQMLAAGDVTLDVSDCPDLVPPLAVQAALRGKGNTTHITNAARLRIKESDRLTAVTTVLNALGAQIEELPDGLVIHGCDGLAGGVTVDSFNDHRIAMMTAMAATRCAAPVCLTDAGCVKKSYPNFWEDYEQLGGKLRQEEEL